MIRYELICCSENSFNNYIRLFSLCFPSSKKFTLEYMDWLYAGNPDGRVLGFNALDGDLLVAHYACIPARVIVGGVEVSALLSLNTATHPGYQGRGLFLKLAELTYAAASAMGYDCVYGVANQNSTPGFLRKLNFNLVGSLESFLYVGELSCKVNLLPSQVDFSRVWSVDSLGWRCSNPANPVSITLKEGRRSYFLAPAAFGGLINVIAMPEVGDWIMDLSSGVKVGSPIKLFVGMGLGLRSKGSVRIDVPNRFRPSPLNLIYRSLSGRQKKIHKDKTFISFLDFDAF